MSHTTPKMLEALQKIKADALTKVHHSVLRALQAHEPPLVAINDDVAGYVLTEAGRAAIGDGDFIVQQRVVNPSRDENDNWKPVATFTARDDAERYASRLSVLNMAVYRVPLPPSKEAIIFDFGKRFIERDGLITNETMPLSFTDPVAADEEAPLFLWRIQRRMSHLYNEGRFSRWEWYGTNRYMDKADADAAARSLAAADTDAYEYRTVGEDLPEANLIVYSHPGDRVDVGLLDALVVAMLPADETIAFADRRVIAAAILIRHWAYDAHTLALLIQELQHAN